MTLHRTTLVFATVAATVGTLSPAAFAGAIDLRIAYRPNDAAVPRVLTLRCDPARGTVAHPADACRRLHAIGPDAFAPTPRGMMCAQLYGGPMTAIVTGRSDGRTVWTRLTRRDGCAIARWQRVAFLLPPVPKPVAGRPPGS